MAKHVVLVVHGIGEQVAGDTVNQVVAGAQAEHSRCERPPVETQTDLVHLTEERFDALKADRDARTPKQRKKPHAQPTLFPMHLKRLICKSDKSDPPQDHPHQTQQETVFAEVFWADKSPAPKGAFATAFDLIKILLAIIYLAIDNAANVQSRAAMFCVIGFTVCFFAGVLAINALLLCGVIVLVLEQPIVGLATLSQSSQGIPAFAAEAVIASVVLLSGLMVYWIYVTRRAYFIWRVFAWGLLFWSGVSVVYILFGAFGTFDGSLNPPTDQTYEIEQIKLYIRWAFIAMAAMWVPGILFCLAAYVVWGAERCCLGHSSNPTNSTIFPHDKVNGQRRFYAPICSAVMLLWMVMSASFWLGIKDLTDRLSVKGLNTKFHSHAGQGLLTDTLSILGEALRTPMVGAVCFIVLIFWVIGLIISRGRNKPDLYKGEKPLRDRLLFNVGLQSVFALASLLIGVMLIYVMFEHLETVDLTGDGFGIPSTVSDTIKRFAAGLSAGLLLLAGVVYNSPAVVGGALGVVRDIVVYASCIKPKIETPKTDSTENFVDRKAIEGRFNTVLEYMLVNEKPDRLTIISHSQGTIVATRCLKSWLKTDPTLLNTTTLITMGSPVTHIYRQYFPTAFAVPKDQFDKINWFGFFRTDDFVGTLIDDVIPQSRNYNMGPGGHPGYFTDPAVWETICDETKVFDKQKNGFSLAP